MYEHNALGYWSGLTLCLTKVRSSRARCPATALIFIEILSDIFQIISGPFLQIKQGGYVTIFWWIVHFLIKA